MDSNEHIRNDIFDKITLAADDISLVATNETPLIGDGTVLDSMKLIEICLLLEDMADEIGFEFDWTSEAAMSRSRGMFRNAGALAAEFLSQMDSGK